jgi:DNA replication protein DnaC
LIQQGEEFCFYCEIIRKEDQQLADLAVAKHEQAKFDRVQEFFNSHSLINPKLLKATFERYEPKNEKQETALKDCKRFAKNFANNLQKENDIGFFLYGGYGLGKSHLAVSILKEVMQQRLPGQDHNIKAIFINLPKLKTKIKDTWRKDSPISEAQLIETLESVELLVLDELGGQANKKDDDGESWFNDIVYQIIDARQGRNTIYTSNLQPEQIAAKYNQKIFERIFDNIHLLEFEGQSYRLGGEF